MAKELQKLELTWIGKGNEPILEPRILIEDPVKSYGDPKAENMLIHGDNLLALKALEQGFTGRIKCVAIDPPFNTGAAFDHYEDGVEHSIWLDLMYRRLKILHRLLSDDGSIFIHLDDNESDYCKMMMDEVFGRNNFINRITVDARSPSAFSTVNPGVFKASEYILWYAKNKSSWESRSMRVPSQRDTAYNKFIFNKSSIEEKWKFVSLKLAFLESFNQDRLTLIEQFLNDIFVKGRSLPKPELRQLIIKIFPLHFLFNLPQITNYLFGKLKDPEFDTFRNSVYIYILEKCSYNYTESDIDSFVFENADCVYRDTEISDEGAGKETVDLKYASLKQPNVLLKLNRSGGLDTVYVINGKQLSFYKKNVAEIEGKLTATKLLTNIWSDISWEGIANEGAVKFKKGKKPERLLKRCLDLATNENDFVIDSFLGSGTTAAVAQKMNRRWVGIEFGEQAITHCLPRLKKVVSGEDNGGISNIVNWNGGGGFKFYTLAPSLIQKDKYGNEVINPTYNANMLAAAMAKQEGFRYSPNESYYWKQGFSSEKDFIFTTTQFITVQTIDRLQEELQSGENLLICCKSFAKACENRYDNITIKKIPQMLLGRCEFGRDDYSLNIVNLPDENESKDENSIEDAKEKIKSKSKNKREDDNQPSLF
jgi:adenine-specific DNA-methyltransferase